MKNPSDEVVIERVFDRGSYGGIRRLTCRQSVASASFSVLLGRIAADVFFWSGR